MDYVLQLKICKHKLSTMEKLNILQFTLLDAIGQMEIGMETNSRLIAALNQVHVV